MNTYRRKQNCKHERKKKSKNFIVLVLLVIVIGILGSCIKTRVFLSGNSIKAPENMLNNMVEDKTKAIQSLFGHMEEDTEWNLVLVNKWNPIPENWKVNLVKIEGGERVDERIKKPLINMLEDAKAENLGQLPKVVSGYRTMEKQQKIYEDKVNEYRRKGYSEAEAENMAEEWVAIPGTSEHQLGLAVDINGATYELYSWLQENSYKYGFIFRYSGVKTDITGVAEEVWHYRYVGVEAATEMYEQGICLEEYLKQEGEPE